MLGRAQIGFLFSFSTTVFFQISARADLHAWGGSAEILSIGSISDRVLWNLRPGLNLNWEPSLSASQNFKLAFEGRVRFDTQSKFLSSGTYFDHRIDRALAQWTGDQASFALGWQKFTWGDSAFWDGVDVLNPRDLNESPYTDDELLKIATPSFSAQYLGGNTVFQAVLTFDTVRSTFPDELDALKVNKPLIHRGPESLEFGLKAGGLLKQGWDINGYLSSHIERVPQYVLVPSDAVPSLRLHEPRVFTLGLTATQSVGDFVFRSELALHSNRAVPDMGSTTALTAEQLVFRATGDFAVWSDMMITGEIWSENWTSPSTERFKNTNVLLGLRVRKPLLTSSLESNLSFLSSDDGEEWLASGGVSWKLLGDLLWNVDVYFVQLSKGHALARRNFKDLIRSNINYQF